MWIKICLLWLIGIASGAAVSGGTFAFIVSLKILPRLLAKTKTVKDTLLYENMVILGGILGNIASVFETLTFPGGTVTLWLYGLCAGIFEGCVEITLAEILHVFPILFRRTKIKHGLSWVIFSFAIGKSVGALYYFINQLAVT